MFIFVLMVLVVLNGADAAVLSCKCCLLMWGDSLGGPCCPTQSVTGFDGIWGLCDFSSENKLG